MINIGCDPGLDGAIAFIEGDKARVFDLPTLKIENGTVGRRVSGLGLKRLILDNVPKGEPVIFIIEALSAGGRSSSAQTVGSQYRTRGTIEAVVECLRLDVHEVSPQRWKKMFGLDKDKTGSLRVARELFPALEHDLKLAKHHNRCEALLLARYAQRVLA